MMGLPRARSLIFLGPLVRYRWVSIPCMRLTVGRILRGPMVSTTHFHGWQWTEIVLTVLIDLLYI